MRSRTQWVIEIDIVGQALPTPKEGWLKIVIDPGAALELYNDLGEALKRADKRIAEKITDQ